MKSTLVLTLKYERPDIDGEKDVSFGWDSDIYGEPTQENLKKAVKEYGATGGHIATVDMDPVSAGGPSFLADTEWTEN